MIANLKKESDVLKDYSLLIILGSSIHQGKEERKVNSTWI
jgi:hypothetical protein